MDIRIIVMLLAFVMSGSLTVIVALALKARGRRVAARLEGLTGAVDPVAVETVTRAVQRTLPKVGKHLMPDDIESQTQLKSRLIHAGFYSPQALPVFLGVKMLLMVGPALLGLAIGLLGLVPVTYGLLFGACGGIVGLIGPSFWLDRRKTKRQTILRRSLPDALDLLVVCMDGGLSLASSLQRVASELRTAHSGLTLELNIVLREIQFGHTLPEALRSFANRTDLDDVRSLAATIKSAERFGASMVKTLRTYAETFRQRRQQYAEEMAQKAGTKILFPTLLFIFPAIFLIILGPAGMQILEMLGNMKR